MKKTLLIFAFSIGLIGCSEDETYFTVKGRVEREINGEGVSNRTVYLKIDKIHVSGSWSSTTEIDSKQVTTDSDGNFSIAMKDDSHIVITAYTPQDDNYTSFEANFAPNNNVILKVNRFEKFRVFVNNTNPFDSNDYINIDFFSSNVQSFVSEIQNFGIQNIHHPAEILPGGGGTGAYEETAWIGINVNSFVIYNVPENANSHKIFWRKKRNGIQTEGITATIPFQPNQINDYNFNY